MNFDHRHYVPCLQWKQGEYQAVLRLSDSIKRLFTPLIEVPEIGYDFEKRRAEKTIDGHLKDVGKRVQKKWGKRACFVDLGLIGPSERMETGIHPVQHVFDDLRIRGCSGVPVSGLLRDNDYKRAVRQVISRDKKGVCLRITIEQAEKSDLKNDISELLKFLNSGREQCDLILDLGAPSFVPLDGFCKVVQRNVQGFPYLNEWRTVTIIGTSFPRTMGELGIGDNVVPRYEWKLYKTLIVNLSQAKTRLPAFGDYAASHPEVPNLDMRLVKPAASIRYTIDDAWYVIKGRNVRDYKFEQYHEHCRSLIASRHYEDPTFSQGDKYILGCANGTASTGNLTTWRWVGTNHHIEKVTRDIARFYGSLGRS